VRPTGAPVKPDVVFLGSSSHAAAAAACINSDCDSHQPGEVFEVHDPGDGDVCISCGTKQSIGGSLHHDHAHSKGHHEQADDERRGVDAAKVYLDMARDHRASLDKDVESRCRKHERVSDAKRFQLAKKILRDSAKAKVAHLHPSERSDVRTKSDVDDLRQSVQNVSQRLRAMSDEATAVVAAAASSAVAALVGHSAAERIGFSVSLGALSSAAAAAAEEDSDSAERPAKRSRLASPEAIIEEAELQLKMYVQSEARSSRQAQAQHKQALKDQLQRETVQVVTAEGEEVTMAEQDVRHALSKMKQRELFGSSAASSAAAAASSSSAAAASSSTASAPGAADDSGLSDEAKQRRVSDALRRNKMVQDTLHPRVDALFDWIYVNCILSDSTSSAPRALPAAASRDYRVHDVHVSWFNRTLQYVVRYKTLRKDEQNRQMRNVELYAMHALIVASWETANPLTWGIMRPALETFLVGLGESEWLQQRDQAMHRYQTSLAAALRDSSMPPPPQPQVGSPSKPKPLGRLSRLDRSLYEFATALGVKGDWGGLVRRLAVWFLIQMQQRVFEHEVGEMVDRCVAVYKKQLRGLQSHDELLCQLGLQSPSTAASSDSAGEPSREPKFLWQFSSVVAAAACVRKVMGNKYLKFNEDEAVNCIVTTYKPSWAKKRQRPSVTKDAQPSMVIKASRFAEIAGVSERQVTACMKLF
jgi:hypothetical protein